MTHISGTWVWVFCHLLFLFCPGAVYLTLRLWYQEIPACQKGALRGYIV